MHSSAHLLTPGQQIKIETAGQSLIGEVRTKDLDGFWVVPTVEKFKEANFKIGTVAHAFILKEDTIFSFDVKLLKKENHPLSFFFSLPQQIVSEKVKCYQPIDSNAGVEGYIPFRYEEVEKRKKEIRFEKQGVAVWISENGMNMVSMRAFPKGALLALEIQLPISQDPIRLFAKVEKAWEHHSLFHTRLLFQAIGAKDRNKILAYCNAKQAQFHRAGTGVFKKKHDF
jgi:hypothetical protein